MATQVIGKVKGDPGFSPVVSLEKSEGVLTISVENEDGTVSESISTGENVQANWEVNDPTSPAYILNKPSISKVGKTNSYSDLDDKPTNLNQFTNGPGYITQAAVPTELSSFTADSTHRLVTDTQISTWNGKANVGDIPTVTDTYSATSSDAMSGKAVASAVSGKANSATTLSGYGITDAATADQGGKADTAVQSVKISGSATELKSGTSVVLPAYPTSLPASDVSDWAKASTKPTYTASEVGALPDTTVIPTVTNTYSATSDNAMSGKAIASALSGIDMSTKADKATTLSGYGITDASIASGVITLGGNTITPLTAASTIDATKVSGTLPSDTYTDTTYVFNTAYNATSNKAATMSDISSAIAGVTQFDYEIVTSLPSTGVKGKIYLKSNSGSGDNVYDEYIYINSKFELLGTTQVNISGKQDKLVEQTAYTSKGSATKVPQITTNSLGQVTGITEVTITQPDISGKADAATTLAGYGITDAKIASGVITLGSNTITPLTSSSTLDATKVSGTLPASTYTNTTYSNFVKSGSGAAAGLVPAPSTTAGTTKYLREDGTWVTPPNDNTTAASSLTCTSANYGGSSATTSVQTALTNLASAIPTGAAASKAVDTSISAGSKSANLPTSAAVATFVEGKGYKTTDNNTTYSFAEGSTNGAFSVTPSGGSATSVKIHGLGSLAYSSATIPTVSDTYSATSTAAMSGKAVASAISGFSSDSNTYLSLTQYNAVSDKATNGKVYFVAT